MAKPCGVVLVSASRRDRASWSVPRCAQVAFAQDGFDDPAQASYRAAAPVPRDRGMFGTVERRHPDRIKAALSGEVGDDGRQERIQMGRARLRKLDHAKAVAD